MNRTFSALRMSWIPFAVARPTYSAIHKTLPLPSSRYASTLAEAAPRIAQPSLWKSIVPKALRGEGQPSPRSNKPKTNQEWNPFMMYIFIFLLIGSNAINLIGLRNDLLNFSQKTDRQVALLAEVIRKVQNGEDVDVAAVLGKGNPEAEKDWENALKELETTDSLYEKEKKKLAASAQRVSEAASKRAQGPQTVDNTKATSEEPTRRKIGFY